MYTFRSLYLPKMIYLSHYNSMTCQNALCLRISNRSLRCRMLSYVRLRSLSPRTTEDSIAAPAVTRFILRLCAHVLVEIKGCILPTNIICIYLSHIRKLDHSYKANVESLVPLDPIINRFTRLSDHASLSPGNIEILDLHLLLKREKPEAVDKQPNLPGPLIHCPLGR